MLYEKKEQILMKKEKTSQDENCEMKMKTKIGKNE